MRPIIRTAAIVAAFMLVSAASSDSRRALDKLAANQSEDGLRYGDGAVKVGRPVSCVPINRIRSTTVRGDAVIDFEMNNRKVYRNILPASCPRLGFEERFSYSTSINQLCSVDIITVLQSPGLSPGPSCGLGQFQPIDGRRR